MKPTIEQLQRYYEQRINPDGLLPDFKDLELDQVIAIRGMHGFALFVAGEAFDDLNKVIRQQFAKIFPEN